MFMAFIILISRKQIAQPLITLREYGNVEDRDNMLLALALKPSA
jgi:hypothetical protein